jgi:hypothetical protein
MSSGTDNITVFPKPPHGKFNIDIPTLGIPLTLTAKAADPAATPIGTSLLCYQIREKIGPSLELKFCAATAIVVGAHHVVG